MHVFHSTYEEHGLKMSIFGIEGFYRNYFFSHAALFIAVGEIIIRKLSGTTQGIKKSFNNGSGAHFL